MKRILLLALIGVSNVQASDEVIFYDKYKIKEVMMDGVSSEEYFDSISCGSYHCYGLKDRELYGIGYNRQYQLGDFGNESQKDWIKITNVVKNVSWVKSRQFGGCLETERGERYHAGKPSFVLDIKKRPIVYKTWVKTEKCFEK